MKNQILGILVRHGRMRRREIADMLKVWTAATELTDALMELERAGQIKSTLYKDMANHECYYLWEVVQNDPHGMMVLKGGKWMPVEGLH